LSAALTATVDREGDELTKAVLAGTVRIEDEAVARTAHDDPFLQIPRATVNVKKADAITRSLTISSAAVEGAELRARRDAHGVIDLLDIVRQTAAGRARPDATAPAPSPTVSGRLVEAAGALALGFQQIHVERIALGPSTFTFVDEAVKP